MQIGVVNIACETLPTVAPAHLRCGKRKRQLQAGAPLRGGPDSDAAVVHHDDFLNDGQAEAGAARASRKERLKNPFAVSVRDSWAVVVHRDHTYTCRSM